MTIDEAIATVFEGQMSVYEVTSPEGESLSPETVLTKVFFGKHAIDQFIKAMYWCTTGRITDPCQTTRPCWTNYQCQVQGCYKGSIQSPVEARLHVLENHKAVTGWSIHPRVVHISEKITAQEKVMTDFEREVQSQRESMASELHELRKRCVHSHPDGRSAVKRTNYARNPVRCMICRRPVAQSLLPKE